MSEVPRFEPEHVSRKLAHEVNRISFFDCNFIFPCYDSPIDNTQILRLAV